MHRRSTSGEAFRQSIAALAGELSADACSPASEADGVPPPVTCTLGIMDSWNHWQ
jgi:hypothetical protein